MQAGPMRLQPRPLCCPNIHVPMMCHKTATRKVACYMSAKKKAIDQVYTGDHAKAVQNASKLDDLTAPSDLGAHMEKEGTPTSRAILRMAS